jgi:sulfur relay protein TusC/DsrF
MAHIVFIVRTAPYLNATTDEAHDFIMASTAYGHSAEVLFEGDGIYQLMKQQLPKNDQKNTAKRIAGFEFFDVEPVWACASTIENKNINREELIDSVSLIEKDKKEALVNAADFTIVF